MAERRSGVAGCGTSGDDYVDETCMRVRFGRRVLWISGSVVAGHRGVPTTRSRPVACLARPAAWAVADVGLRRGSVGLPAVGGDHWTAGLHCLRPAVRPGFSR